MMAKKFEQDCSHSVQSVFEKGTKTLLGQAGRGGMGKGRGQEISCFCFLWAF
jgi:hypothetical protein